MLKKFFFLEICGSRGKDFKTLYAITLYDNFDPALESKPFSRGHASYNFGKGLSGLHIYEFRLFSIRCVGVEMKIFEKGSTFDNFILPF